MTGARETLSAYLLHSAGRAPNGIGSEDISVESFAQRQAQTIRKGQALSRTPATSGPLCVVTLHRLDPDVVAGEQRPRKIPVTPGCKNLLRHLGPVGCSAHRPGQQRALNCRGAVFALEKCQDG